MTVPPNTAGCLSIWLIVWISSRVDKRAPFILGSAVVAIIGVCVPYKCQVYLYSLESGYIILLTARSGMMTLNSVFLAYTQQLGQPAVNMSAFTSLPWAFTWVIPYY